MSFIVQPGQVQWSQSQMAVSLEEYCHFSQLSRYSASVNMYSQHIVNIQLWHWSVVVRLLFIVVKHNWSLCPGNILILNYSEILWEQGSWDQEQVYLKVPKWWWVIQRPVRYWEQLCKVGICLQRLNVSKFNQFWYSDNRCQACLAWYELVMSYFMWWERDTCDISAELSRNLWSSETKIVTLELHQNKLEPECRYIKCPLWLLRSNPRFLQPISTCFLYCIESHQPLIQI